MISAAQVMAWLPTLTTPDIDIKKSDQAETKYILIDFVTKTTKIRLIIFKNSAA